MGFKQRFSQLEDKFSGRLRSSNITEFRNMGVINVQENLDDDYPMYIYFNVPSTTNKIVSVTLSFWILKYQYAAAGGITAVDKTPTINFYISDDDGASYSDVYGPYTTDQSQIDIASDINDSGDKVIKITTDLQARLSVQATIKLDINAR